jgi:hypothetical protein
VRVARFERATLFCCSRSTFASIARLKSSTVSDIRECAVSDIERELPPLTAFYGRVSGVASLSTRKVINLLEPAQKLRQPRELPLYFCFGFLIEDSDTGFHRIQILEVGRGPAVFISDVKAVTFSGIHKEIERQLPVGMKSSQSADV